jgi:hypothetical protein
MESALFEFPSIRSRFDLNREPTKSGFRERRSMTREGILVSRQWSQRAFPLVIAVLAFVVIAPTLKSGWLGDDAFNSVLAGILGADRISLWQAMRHAFDLWFFGSGRFYPVHIAETYLVFYFFTNLFAYKLLLVSLTIATVEMFRRCVALYTSRGIGNLSALIAVSLLAVRGYHDAILSYNAMPQLVAIFVLGSLMAYRHVLRQDAGVWRLWSVVLYALAALTYEDAYGFSLLYVALAAAGRRSWRDVLHLSCPYVAIGVGLALFSLAARIVAGVPEYSPYGFNGAPNAALRTLAEQIVAAFPLSYYLFDPSRIFSRSNLYDFYNNAPLNPIVFVAFAGAMAYALHDAARDRADGRGPMAMGAAVVLLAAAPIAVLVKYQTELRPGLGYLPVFYEEFGVGLTLAGLAAFTLRRANRRAWQLLWTVSIAAIATFTAATNVRVVREAGTREARRSLERQLDGGLLASVPDGSFVTVAPQDWIAYDGQGPEGISTRGLFFLHGRKRIALVEPSDPRARVVLRYDFATQRWSVERRPL